MTKWDVTSGSANRNRNKIRQPIHTPHSCHWAPHDKGQLPHANPVEMISRTGSHWLLTFGNLCSTSQHG
jgi:hypothetical protein